MIWNEDCGIFSTVRAFQDKNDVQKNHYNLGIIQLYGLWEERLNQRFLLAMMVLLPNNKTHFRITLPRIPPELRQISISKIPVETCTSSTWFKYKKVLSSTILAAFLKALYSKLTHFC